MTPLKGLLANPAYRAVWRMARTDMNADYRDHLDKLMKEVRPSEPRDVAQVWKAYFNEERGPAPSLS